ncbi:uncharacterized protein LOC107827925 [Nicotiana tabacum]|uniref:Eukaryotic translation initiation factor 5B-like n=1 Tax=Nicotiana tabacum TaxID=4097 RepID=A0A1S4DB19_TOBAC|nr:PREDICTED: eukaryotic translation initiation factor 5B-like [Nicotiana tabacum]
MATETVSSDHPTSLEQVEKEVHEEVKTMDSPKDNEVKPKEDSPSQVLSSAESVENINIESVTPAIEEIKKKSDEEENSKVEEPAQTVIEEIKKKADEDEKPTIEEVKKTDEVETPKTEQQAPAITATEEVNKHVETPASDVTREEVVVLNKESAPEPEADSVPEEAVDVVKGELESEKVEIPQKESEKELQDKPTIEELQANEPQKAVAKEEEEEEVSEAEQNKERIVANVEDKLAEQPEVSEKIEQEPAETKPENTEAITDVLLKEEVGKVEEINDTKDVKTNQEDEKKSVVTEAKEVETCELPEKAPEVEIAPRGIELISENRNKKDEINLTTEVHEATEVEKKVNETTATVTEKSVEESQKPETETKVEEETAGEVEPKLEQKVKTDAAKDGEERKTLEEAFKEEVPPKTKQSNNLISKMKQSLVKAKKAIIGKSPSSKSETKNEVTAK